MRQTTLKRLFLGAALAALAYFGSESTRTTIVTASSDGARESLTGNWAVKTPRNDGTISKAYFNLKHEDGKITGTIR